MKEEQRKVGYRDIIKQTDYVKLIIANIINRFGDSIDSIAFTWLVYQLTNSAAWSAIVYGVNRIPTIFLQPIAGAIVENHSKKSVMIITDIIRGICVCFIAVAFGTGMLQPWMLLITSLILSSAEAFRLPSSSAVVQKILRSDTYEFGISLNASVSSVVELIGLGMAGFIIAQFGIVFAVAIDAATFIGSAIIIMMIDTKERIVEKKQVQVSDYFHLLKAGGKYVLSNKTIFSFIVLAVLANAMFVPINSLQAPLISEVLKSDESMLSVLSIFLSLSMLISTVTYPYVSRLLSGKIIVLISGVSFGIYYIALVGIGEFVVDAQLKTVLVCISSFIAGYLVSFLSTYCSVSFMKVVEPAYISRTVAIMNAAGASATPIVAFIISAEASVVSTKDNFIDAGVFLIIIMTILSFTMDFSINKTTETAYCSPDCSNAR